MRLCVGLWLFFMGAVGYAQDKVVLRINEWPSYVSMHKEAFEAYAKSKGMNVTLEVIKPDISDEQVIFDNVRTGNVDVLTPTESFIHARQKKLLKLLAPVDVSKVVGYNNVPESLRNSPFHMEGGKHYGIVFMAGYYGLYYNTKTAKEPKSWDVLFAPENKGKFSVSRDTYFVNAHIAQWSIDSTNIEAAYSADKMDAEKLSAKLKTLAGNAHHLWDGIGNKPESLSKLSYTASWGFELGPDWKLAFPAPGSPMWIDVLSITEAAAKDPKKLEAFYHLASFAVQADTQKVFAEKLRALPISSKDGKLDLAKFDPRFFWRPLDDRTGNLLKKIWSEAAATSPKS